MTPTTREELMSTLSELSEHCPQVRLGQLIANSCGVGLRTLETPPPVPSG